VHRGRRVIATLGAGAGGIPNNPRIGVRELDIFPNRLRRPKRHQWARLAAAPRRALLPNPQTPACIEAAGPENAEGVYLSGADLAFGGDLYDSVLKK
jgi:hypothetical protein